MMDDDGKLEMFQRAAFGKQVDDFMRSDVGQYVLARAAAQIADAHADFRKVDCNKAEAVFALQNKIAVAEAIVQWLGDAVSDGLKALEIIEDRS